ncbi:peptidase domain-containing ABC transporter [Skermanella rosea]|uniref:peptidase domain-containing ABC transporter n=1 Tax=Skermanella rosea TaxID=1817965 RepID=UPI001931E5A0
MARLHGAGADVDRVIRTLMPGREPSAGELVRAARTAGLEASSHVGLDWERLRALASSAPVIAMLRNGNAVVVHGIAADGGTAVVLDPLADRPAPLVLPRARFEAAWTGVAVLILPPAASRPSPPADRDGERRFGLGWFVPELLRQRALMGDVVLAALMIHAIALAVPVFFQIVVDKVLVHEGFSTLAVLGVGIVAAILVEAVLGFLRGTLLLHATTKVDIRVAARTFAHLLSLSPAFFETSAAGVLAKHMQQAERVREFLTGRMMLTLLDASVLMVFLPVLAFYSPHLTAVVLGFSATMAAAVGVLIVPYQRRLRRLYRAEGERQALLVETIHGMATVKALGLEPERRRAWEDGAADAVTHHFEVGRIGVVARTASALLEKLMTVAIVWLGALAVIDQRMTVGELVAFQMLASRVSAPLVQIVSLVHEYQEAALSVRMLGEIMDAPPERGSAEGLRPDLAGGIEFRGVTFRYPGRDPGTPEPALADVSATIRAGQFVGVVGRSGSGKTTFARLIQGFHAAEAGLILLDGHDIREIDLAHLRRSIGVVPQDAFLFRGTIRENIALSRPDAPPGEVAEAAGLAGAAEFIQRLPHGFDTMLEEGAVNLSGGQKQRLSIARALLRRPPILILDEATSALDPDSEAEVQANLHRIARGRTTLLVSHRLTTLRDADLILVFEHGRIIDSGRHDDLVERCALYRQLWTQQTSRIASA